MFEFPSFAMHDMGIKRRVTSLGCANETVFAIGDAYILKCAERCVIRVTLLQ